MSFKQYFISGLCFFVLSCSFFKETDDRVPIARVNDSYLYKDDIKDLIADGISDEDSTLIVNGFINRWATRRLLIEGALLNLPEEEQAEFDKLVTQYKNDLYTKAYLDALVKKNIDSTVTPEEAKEVYENNRETFKLNEELVKFRYLSLPENALNKAEVEKRFKRFDDEDKQYLDSISVQFKTYSL
ncbi:MAG TPA: hypothetical protein VJ945_01735, partial [Flavobacteriaceae bacterium]|nr:hypothetical protein [Flavobacteriaceae bacterium]